MKKNETVFKDHFSGQSGYYATYRPAYPEELYRTLAESTPGSGVAWDCGCGSGQASAGLSRYFGAVIATDPSLKQISGARKQPGIKYAVAKAENACIKDDTIDLVTVAQALHWFDVGKFYGEARRVLKPGGVIAVWIYNLMTVNDEVDEVINAYYSKILGTYWPPERRHIENCYETIPFDFADVRKINFTMEAEWTMDMLVGMFHSWSATQICKERTGCDPVEQISNDLINAWGNEKSVKRVKWPIAMKLGFNK